MDKVFNCERYISDPGDDQIICVVLKDDSETRLVLAIDHQFELIPKHWENSHVQLIDCKFRIILKSGYLEGPCYRFTNKENVISAAEAIRVELRLRKAAYEKKLL